MKIKIFAEIEVSVSEQLSRVDYATITLEDEAILEIAKSIESVRAVQQGEYECPICGSTEPNIHSAGGGIPRHDAKGVCE